MFGLFKKKSKKEQLFEKHKKLLAEAHRLSHSDRKASDAKMVEADDVLQQAEKLED